MTGIETVFLCLAAGLKKGALAIWPWRYLFIPNNEKHVDRPSNSVTIGQKIVTEL